MSEEKTKIDMAMDYMEKYFVSLGEAYIDLFNEEMKEDIRYYIQTCPICNEVKSVEDFGKNSCRVHGADDKCKDCRREYNKDFYHRFPEKSLANHHNRRARKNDAGGYYTDEQIKECISFFDNKCAYSGKNLDDTSRTNKLHREHIVALANGGTNWIWNICTSTASVNTSKNNKNMEEWYREQSYFSEERLAKIYEWQKYSYNKYSEKLID